jgi:hypothetical protein
MMALAVESLDVAMSALETLKFLLRYNDPNLLALIVVSPEVTLYNLAEPFQINQ